MSATINKLNNESCEDAALYIVKLFSTTGLDIKRFGKIPAATIAMLERIIRLDITKALKYLTLLTQRGIINKLNNINAGKINRAG